MSHTEHFGISYANIVYAFLVRVDLPYTADAIRQIFGPNSGEKKTLIEFLLKKRGNYRDTVVGSEERNGLELPLFEMKRGATGDLVRWSHIVDGRYSSVPPEETECASSMQMRWRLTTSDVVTQLTIVRNAFMANILDFGDTRETSGISSFFHSMSMETLGPIPISSTDGLPTNIVMAIENSICKLCARLRQACPPGSLTRSMVASGSSVTSGLPAQWDWNEAHTLASVVELVWALSVSVVLDACFASVVCAGGLVHSCRFLFGVDGVFVSEGGEFGSHLSLLPPVFFLTRGLAVTLEAHFNNVLQSACASVAASSRVYYFLLARSCYELLSQIDERSVIESYATSVRFCVSLVKEARLSCETWEDVKWEDLITETKVKLSTVHRKVLVQDLDYLWRLHRSWSEKTMSDRSALIDDTRTDNTPIIFSGRFPSFLCSRFQRETTELLNLCTSLKSLEVSKGDEVIGKAFCTIYFRVLSVCHVFHHESKEASLSSDLLDLVGKMLPLSKKEKRLRGIITLLLMGCFFPQPTPRGVAGRRQHDVDGASAQITADTLLNEVDPWRKCKNSTWYAVSVAALLGSVNPVTFLKKVPTFLKTLRGFFSSADNLDKSSILYAMLHVGGLLMELHVRQATPFPTEVEDCLECFFHYAEKMLVKDMQREKWREGTGAPVCIAAASELFLFILQQRKFFVRATNWLLRLLNCGNGATASAKGGKGSTICCGQLLAMRALSGLCELKSFPMEPKVSIEVCSAKERVLACNLNCGNHDVINEVYDELSDAKAQIRNRIIGMLLCRGSCYNYVVTTVEGPTVFWHDGYLRDLLEFVTLTDNIQFAIDEIRKAAFVYLNEATPEIATSGTNEFKLQLVSVLIVAGFFTPVCAMLDRSLTIPKLLVDSSLPLREAVARVLLPLYLNGGNGSNGSRYGRRSLVSYAFAIHRLAESVVDALVNKSSECVDSLVRYLTSHLLELKDEMEYIALADIYTQKNSNTSDRQPLLDYRCDSLTASEGDSAAGCFSTSRWERWNWLLIPMNKNVDQMKCWSSSKKLQHWCVVGALEGTTLIDALESLAIVLLGHTRRSVRRQALLQLDILATLISYNVSTARIISQQDMLLPGKTLAPLPPLPAHDWGPIVVRKSVIHVSQHLRY